ncbi:hydroxyacid dehydrogenase [Sphingobium lactosutens]|uniref:2-hydroxyacid dehydrogenase n=1 Tax=Sphingobium lactosutens TaxID=522773 RepID=UPI0015B8C146|nr:2-hydroxyacid dehydrogenase [Sphingobium lactosutens]NWK99147.1 hydroxyacid dehydrogenase [Sphingobium lactosutens]
MTVASLAEPVLLYLEHLKVENAFAEFSTPIMRSSIGDLSHYAKGEGKDIRAVITAGGAPMEEAVWDLPNLGLIACLGAGYDGIDVERARKRGIQVTTGRGVNDEDVADMAIGLLLAAVRQIPRGDRLIRVGAWKKQPELAMSRSVSLMRCGIVGLGAIGSAIGRRLTGFGSPIAWWGPRSKPGAPWPKADSLLALARDSDILIVAAPASDQTNGLISADVLEALGSDGYLVNISRGSLIEEEALIAALQTGGIAGAGLDVFVDEPHDGSRWKDMENVAMTPHIGAWAERGIAEAKRMCALNVEAFLRGEPLYTPLF